MCTCELQVEFSKWEMLGLLGAGLNSGQVKLGESRVYRKSSMVGGDEWCVVEFGWSEGNRQEGRWRWLLTTEWLEKQLVVYPALV